MMPWVVVCRQQWRYFHLNWKRRSGPYGKDPSPTPFPTPNGRQIYSSFLHQHYAWHLVAASRDSAAGDVAALKSNSA
eukprot:scaffold14566_cov269-Alexandrium_tamarense.AAC.1